MSTLGSKVGKKLRPVIAGFFGILGGVTTYGKWVLYCMFGGILLVIASMLLAFFMASTSPWSLGSVGSLGLILLGIGFVSVLFRRFYYKRPISKGQVFVLIVPGILFILLWLVNRLIFDNPVLVDSKTAKSLLMLGTSLAGGMFAFSHYGGFNAVIPDSEVAAKNRIKRIFFWVLSVPLLVWHFDLLEKPSFSLLGLVNGLVMLFGIDHVSPWPRRILLYGVFGYFVTFNFLGEIVTDLLKQRSCNGSYTTASEGLKNDPRWANEVRELKKQRTLCEMAGTPKGECQKQSDAKINIYLEQIPEYRDRLVEINTNRDECQIEIDLPDTLERSVFHPIYRAKNYIADWWSPPAPIQPKKKTPEEVINQKPTSNQVTPATVPTSKPTNQPVAPSAPGQSSKPPAPTPPVVNNTPIASTPPPQQTPAPKIIYVTKPIPAPTPIAATPAPEPKPIPNPTPQKLSPEEQKKMDALGASINNFGKPKPKTP